MNRTIWLQFATIAILFAALMADEHVIHAQAAQLHRLSAAMVDSSNTMTQARHALRVQGDALSQCMRVVYPPPMKRPMMLHHTDLTWSNRAQ